MDLSVKKRLRPGRGTAGEKRRGGGKERGNYREHAERLKGGGIEKERSNSRSFEGGLSRAWSDSNIKGGGGKVPTSNGAPRMKGGGGEAKKPKKTK